MQYVAIKREEKDGTTHFIVNAITLKNKNKSVVQKIPHPLGSDSLIFNTIEEAKEAILRAGFSYILPDGKKETPSKVIEQIMPASNETDKFIFNTIKKKTDSSNSSICAAAIIAIAEFPTEETFDILFKKIGEENDTIRKNAISGICRYGKILQQRIIDSLQSENWITRNSAITCIINLKEDINIDLENFIHPLVKNCDDVNPIVQANALMALAAIYQQHQKNKKT